MSSPSKAKGNRAEVKVVKYLLDRGVSAVRAWGSNGRALGHHEEVDVLASGNCKIQVKARKVVPALIRDSLTEHVDVAVLIQDRTEPVVVMRLEDFANILKQHGWKKG